MDWARSAGRRASWRWPARCCGRMTSPHNRPMSVRIYSTLTGREDELLPSHPDGVLRMYVCGMTPKFHPHVGHARLFVAMDVIRRYLLFRGYNLKLVQNFTDVDDKIIQRALSEGRKADETARA